MAQTVKINGMTYQLARKHKLAKPRNVQHREGRKILSRLQLQYLFAGFGKYSWTNITSTNRIYLGNGLDNIYLHFINVHELNDILVRGIPDATHT